MRRVCTRGDDRRCSSVRGQRGTNASVYRRVCGALQLAEVGTRACGRQRAQGAGRLCPRAARVAPQRPRGRPPFIQPTHPREPRGRRNRATARAVSRTRRSPPANYAKSINTCTPRRCWIFSSCFRSLHFCKNYYKNTPGYFAAYLFTLNLLTSLPLMRSKKIHYKKSFRCVISGTYTFINRMWLNLVASKRINRLLRKLASVYYFIVM